MTERNTYTNSHYRMIVKHMKLLPFVKNLFDLGEGRQKVIDCVKSKNPVSRTRPEIMFSVSEIFELIFLV